MKKASFLTATFLWGYCLHAQIIYQTAGFLLEINSKSEVVKLVDRQNKVNNVPADHPGYLVRVKTTSKKELAPIKMQADKNLRHFSFAEGIALQVKIAAKATHLCFELVKTKEAAKEILLAFNNPLDYIYSCIIPLSSCPSIFEMPIDFWTMKVKMR